MGLYLRDDGKNYWFTITANGRRHQHSTGTDNKRLAEKIYAKALLDVHEGRWFQNEAKRRTFKELTDRYMQEHSAVNKAQSSQARDVCAFKQLGRAFDGHRLADISPVAISRYKTLRRTDGAKPATIAKELELLRNALNLAIREWEWLETNPFTKVKIERPNNKVERWLTDKEEQKLLSHAPDWLKPIIVFTLNTGLRRGELVGLKWTDIDIFRKTLTLLKTKNKERRTIPLNNTVLDVLKAKGNVRPISGFVFASEDGTGLNGQHVYRALKRSAEEAGIAKLRFHDLRHTFATRLVQAGIDLYVVMELLGHKSLTMTMRYAHHYPESLRHGVDVLDRLSEDSARICYDSATVAIKREITLPSESS